MYSGLDLFSMTAASVAVAVGIWQLSLGKYVWTAALFVAAVVNVVSVFVPGL